MLYILFIILAVVLIVLFLIMPCKLEKQEKEKFKGNYAHRGYYTNDQKIPENSLKAFKRARDNNFGIEFDIRLTVDDKICVFHDDTLIRTSGIKQKVVNHTLEQLNNIKLFKTENTIPSFKEVLKIVDGKIPLIIEFKSEHDYPLLCEKAMEILKDYKGIYCVESFDPKIVHWFKKNRSDIIRGQLLMPYEHYKNQNKYLAFLVSNCLLNFYTRPHFIAYNTQRNSFLAKLAIKLGAMQVVWTVKPYHDHDYFAKTCDCVIFEHYNPSQYHQSN